MFYYDMTAPFQPRCKITIANSNKSTHNSTTIDAIVDTGADISCIPSTLIDDLNLKYTKRSARDFQGKKVDLRSACVDINIQDDISHINTTHCRMDVFCIDDTVAIIGRDILNQYKVVFNNHIPRWGMDCSCSSIGCILSPNTTPDVS